MLNARRRGQVLLELLLAAALALTLLGGASATLARLLAGNATDLNRLRLGQELAALRALLVAELTRAGAWAMPPGADPADNPFNRPGLRLTAHDDCVLFGYDRNRNGVADPQERYGLRLRGGALQARKAGRQCHQPGWEDLTDPALLTVTALRFRLVMRPQRLASGETLIRQRLDIDLSVQQSSAAITTSTSVAIANPLLLPGPPT